MNKRQELLSMSSKETKFKDLLVRSLTGLIFLFVIIGASLWNIYSFHLLYLILAVLSLNEYFNLLRKDNSGPERISGFIAGISIYSGIVFFSLSVVPLKFVPLFLIPVVFPFIIELYRKKESPLVNISFCLFGIFYLVIPFSLLSSIALKGHNWSDFAPINVILLFSFVWIYDSAAYLFGISFGKHRLLERISPKKSWEGAIGGALVTILFAWSIAGFFGDYSLPQLLIIASIMIIFGTFGDLFESMIKRSMQIKDSGKLLPGHGGILDRFDALFLSIPVVWIYLQFIN